MSGISLGRVTTLLLLGRVAGYALALGNSVILARVLGVDRLGAYAYAMGVAALFGLLPNLGISTVLTRAIARDPDAGTGVVRAAMRAQALLAGGVLIAPQPSQRSFSRNRPPSERIQSSLRGRATGRKQ